jgi:predicted esterase
VTQPNQVHHFIGFSSAIMAAALLLSRPRLLAAATLVRPLSPFRDDPTTHLHGLPAIIVDGGKDSRRSPGDGTRLMERLRKELSLTTLNRKIAPVWLQGPAEPA